MSTIVPTTNPRDQGPNYLAPSRKRLSSQSDQFFYAQIPPDPSGRVCRIFWSHYRFSTSSLKWKGRGMPTGGGGGRKGGGGGGRWPPPPNNSSDNLENHKLHRNPSMRAVLNDMSSGELSISYKRASSHPNYSPIYYLHVSCQGPT